MTQPNTLSIVLTFAGVAIAAVLGWLGARYKAKADRDTTTTKTLLDALVDRVDKLETKVTSLEADLEQARTERDEARRPARAAEDTLRDRTELLDDYVEHSEEMLSWASNGATPPPPVPSWRIRQYLADLAANAAQLRRQQSREDTP